MFFDSGDSCLTLFRGSAGTPDSLGDSFLTFDSGQLLTFLPGQPDRNPRCHSIGTVPWNILRPTLRGETDTSIIRQTICTCSSLSRTCISCICIDMKSPKLFRALANLVTHAITITNR